MSELSNPDITTNSTSSDSNPLNKKSPKGAVGQHGFKAEAMTTRSKDADSGTRRKSHSPIIMKEEWILTPLKKTPSESRKRPSSSLSSKDSSDKELPVKENIKEKGSTLPPPPFKKRKNGQEYNHDYYCWICHKEGTSLQCELCPRVFHVKCIDLLQEPEGEWVCVECEKTTMAECTDTQSRAMSMLTVDQLAYLLKCALSRMKHAGADAFLKPVSLELFPTYEHYIYNPMDLSTLEKNIKKKIYGCTEAFLSDAKWIVHNCIVFNGYHHKFTAGAKMIVKICKHEMSEIEVCPDCYMNSCTQNENWFCEPCRKPHILVWAKLKGFPFWPAKALRTADGNIDVRFFGAHDRAWIPDNQCYILSKTIPTPVKNKKKGGFEQSMEELDLHIQRLRETYGHFEYAPFRTPFDIDKPLRQVDPSRRLTDFPKLENITAKRFKTLSKTPKRNYFSSTLPSPNYSVRESSGNNTKTLNKLSNGTNKNGLHKIKMELLDENSKEMEMDTPNIRTREKVVNRYSTSPRNTNTKPREALPTPGAEEIDSEKTKIVPTGVFESDKLDIKLKSLELNIPKLDKSKISKPSLENIKKLEILTSALNDENDEDEEEINSITPNQSPPISVNKLLEDSESSVKSQSLPLSSPPVKLEDDELSSEMPSPSSISTDVKQSPPKKNSLFTIQLDKTIASCKAKLGLDELPENHLQTNEESEDEDNSRSVKSEIVNDKDENKTDSKDEEEKSSISAESCKSRGSSSDDLSKSDSEDKSLEGSYKTNKQFSMENSETNSSVKSDENAIKIGSEKDHSKDEMRTTCDSALNANTSIKHSPSGENCGQSKEQQHAGLDMDCESEGELVINLDADSSDYKQNPSVETKTTENKLDLIDVSRNEQEIEEEPPLQSPQETNTGTDKVEVNSPIITNITKEIDPVITTTSGCQLSSTISNNNFIASQTTNSHIEAPRSTPSPATPSPAAPSPSEFDFSKYTDKVLNFVKNTFEEMIHEFYPLSSKIPTDQNMKAQLALEIEKLRWRHQQEVSETKHNSDLTLFEMRACLEAEKQQMLKDLRKQLEQDKIKVIEDTKKKQWCAMCGKEALFYCCWNTSYCDYPCQQSHWPQHMITCTQSQSTEKSNLPEKGNTVNNQVQKVITLQKSPTHTGNTKVEAIKYEQKPTACDKGSEIAVMPTKVECTPQLEFIPTNISANLTSVSSSVLKQYKAHPLSNPSLKTTTQPIRIASAANIPKPLMPKPETSGQPSVPTLSETQPLISKGKVLYPVLHPQGKCALPKQIVIAPKASIQPNNVQPQSIQLQLRPL